MMKFKYLLLLTVYFLSSISNLQSVEKKNILIINSYHKGLQWTDEIVKGINDGLELSFIEKEIFTEFLDSKRVFNKNHKVLLYNFYKIKYQNKNIDIIILSDDFALDFMLEYRDSLFGEIPVVFCGINNPHSFSDSYTGILEDIEYVDNFKLIRQLHPDYSKIYFIVDQTKTGNIIYDRAYRLYLPMKGKYNYEFLRNYSFDELFEKVSQLDDKSVIFLAAFTKDRNNKYCSYDEIIRNLRKHTEASIYGAWNFYLGKGIVGGKVICGYDQGFRAAIIANRIFNGEDINDINIETSSASYKFDYKELKNKNISRKKLPKGSSIINNPFDFITKNKQQTIFFGIICILLFIIILIMWVYLWFRKRKNKEQVRCSKSLDITNEKLRLAKEKIEDSNRLKGAFLANMSHEFRTPMNGIIGFAELLKDTENIDHETRKQYIDIIQKSGNVLLNLIDDIIELSKIETNQLNINYSEFALNIILDELLQLFLSERGNLEKNDIDIIVEKEFDFKNLVIYSDENRLRQVLYNLLSNALKFTSKGTIKFGYYIELPNLVFFVKDTGIGLTDVEKDIIFDRFRQVEDKVTRRYAGSGLGLSVSKGIVENLKGKIWVDSESGVGSTFYFTIPYQIVNANKKEKSLKTPNVMYEWPNKTILIVEDAIVSYELIIKFLKNTKAKFLHVVDGEQAVELCRRNGEIDLVLMDIQLPIMDGLEATSQIKEFKPDLPIIAQTANAMYDDRVNIIDAGCDDYVSKPINRQELYEKIDHYINNLSSV